jgi:very-short-patch-repair endonuclease
MSDRWVIFARPRSDSFILRDIDRLKAALDRAAAAGIAIPGATRALVLGPGEARPVAATHGFSAVLGRPIDLGPEPDEPSPDNGDLFFPLPYNDDQIEIVRRLERSDGVVVQGPPGTGKTHTIANIICHYLALGLRVLVVSHGEAALAVLRDKLPASVRELAISLTATDKEGLRQAETAVRRLQTIVETVNPHQQARLINKLERDLIACRDRIAAIDDQVAEIARRNLEPFPGLGERAFDLAKKLVAARDGFAWFADRPGKLIAETGLAMADIDAAREARQRVGEDLRHIDDALPTDLPDAAHLARLHEDLQRAAALSAADTASSRLAQRALAKLGLEGAGRLASELETLAAAHRLIADEPWLAPLSPVGKGSAPAHAAALVDLAEDARPQFKKRASFLSRPVDAPTDAFGQNELIEIIDRLAAGQKVFTAFALKEKKHKPVIESISVAGFAPANAADWAHVRDYLAWRRETHSLAARWRSLAEELGAPVSQAASEPPIRALEQVVHWAEIALVAAGEAKLCITAAAEATFAMPRGEIEALVGNKDRVEALAAAIRDRIAAASLAAARAEVARLEGLFSGAGILPEAVRKNFLSQLGASEIDSERIDQVWTKIAERIEHLRARAADFERIDRAIRALVEAGAPLLGARLRSEPAGADGDPVLVADWSAAWDWAALMHQLAHLGQRQVLQKLSDERRILDSRLRDLFEQVVAARTHLGLSQRMSGPVKQALTAFMIALRKIGVTGRGPTANRHRRVAREALQDCYAGIPCWIMPSWRVCEQLPAELGAFDVVILDEASQSDVRELTALIRGKKVLVVGDDKQVSPIVIGIENDKIERLEHNFLRAVPRTVRPFLLPGSSLYDLAKVMFPDKLIILKEHFRCVEPIIRFSTQFYDERLVPLRVPTATERLDPPLVDIHVRDGRRRPGQKINDREAEVIVDEVAMIVNRPDLARFPGSNRWRSIGVISLIGNQQAALINRRLMEDARIGEDVVLRHRIACGDSATFQGNERDIVFLSMVADSLTRVAQTASHYMQRFNVAMSRARDRLVLVRSVGDEILNPNDLKAKVIRHFRDPFAGAASAARHDGVDLAAGCESDFERAVLRRLLALGYRVHPQVGAHGYRIDLVVEGEDDCRLAIECDGDREHEPQRWFEDMRRQRVLERVGWHFRRYWASDFVLDPEGCLAELTATLARLGIEPQSRLETERAWTQHRSVGDVDDVDCIDDVTGADGDVLGSGDGGARGRDDPRLAEGRGRRAFPARRVRPLAVAAADRSPAVLVQPRTPVRLAANDRRALPAPGPLLEAVAVEDAPPPIQVGDRVTIQYLDDPKQRRLTYLICEDASDETRGVLSISSSLGQALLTAAVEDEIEFVDEGRGRSAIVLAIHPPLLLAAE